MKIFLRNFLLEQNFNVKFYSNDILKKNTTNKNCNAIQGPYYALQRTYGDKIKEKENVTGPLFIGAHAAAGFARAGLVSDSGKILKVVLESTKVFHSSIFYEQSSDDIWRAIVESIKKLIKDVDVKNIQGIGFVGTPSLVCINDLGQPVTVSVKRIPDRNCILYYDHRSILEAEKINHTRHALLRYFGDRMSPDIQESKLMWLKNNLRAECWEKAKYFFDMPDFLTWKATGSNIRSSSALVSRWSYEMTTNDVESWNRDFFNEIGLPELEKDNWKMIGPVIQRPGTPIEGGLSEKVAKEMGLPAGLPVATSMGDAEAGGLGLTGCQSKEVDSDVTTRLCIVYGTHAASHFISSVNPVFIKGVWGPFKDCILPGMWLNHGGQTTAESLIEHVIDHHAATAEIKKTIGRMSIQKYLNKFLRVKAKTNKLKATSYLTKDVHVWPDFSGNRSPLADAKLRGMMSGLTLGYTQDSLALQYLATIQSLAYSTRQIMEALTQSGHKIKSIVIGGGLGKNSLFTFLHKDICQLPTVVPDEASCKIIGAAILGAIAANHFTSFDDAVQSMCGKGTSDMPNPEMVEYHEKKYKVFLKMYEHQMEYRRMMS